MYPLPQSHCPHPLLSISIDAPGSLAYLRYSDSSLHDGEPIYPRRWHEELESASDLAFIKVDMPTKRDGM